MVMNHEIIVFTPILAVLIGFIFFTILKKRKRSAKSIYKLIDDLEKKYIYSVSYTHLTLPTILRV